MSPYVMRMGGEAGDVKKEMKVVLDRELARQRFILFMRYRYEIIRTEWIRY